MVWGVVSCKFEICIHIHVYFWVHYFFCHNLQLGHCLRSLALPRFLANLVRLGPHCWMVCWFIFFLFLCGIAGCIGECHWSGSWLVHIVTLRVVFHTESFSHWVGQTLLRNNMFRFAERWSVLLSLLYNSFSHSTVWFIKKQLWL